MKGSRVESIEEARNEYMKLLEEGWGKTYKPKRQRNKKKDSYESR